MSLNVLLLGLQGSGKGTQGRRIAGEYGLAYIGTGDMLRSAVAAGTDLGKRVQPILESGLLVPDDLMIDLIGARIAEEDALDGFVLDGFPRTVRQAEFFLESYDIDGVINLELPDSEVERRVLARRLCSGCGLDYNLIAHRPRDANVCDVCGSPLVVREDDNPEALAVRLREYHDKTTPVIELFQRKEFVASIDATRSIPEIQAEIRARFDLPPPR